MVNLGCSGYSGEHQWMLWFCSCGSWSARLTARVQKQQQAMLLLINFYSIWKHLQKSGLELIEYLCIAGGWSQTLTDTSTSTSAEPGDVPILFFYLLVFNCNYLKIMNIPSVHIIFFSKFSCGKIKKLKMCC